MTRILRLVPLLWAAMLVPAFAQVDAGAKVHARLIAEREAVVPGGTVTVALELATRPGWHTYWINPGDAGAPTEIKWTLPPGWRAGAIQWPAPQTEAVGPLMDYGYEGKPWLLVDITAPKDAAPGAVTLQAAASWLVCAEVCVPEDANLTLQLGVGQPSLPPDADFAAARAKLPVASPWPMHYASAATLDLFVQAEKLARAHPAKAEFFPLAPDSIKGIAPQELGFADSGIVLHLQPARSRSAARCKACSCSRRPTARSRRCKSTRRPARCRRRRAAAARASRCGSRSLFAFLGGLILNLMPCVLPILAMKALALAGHGGGGRHAAREGLAYGVGAILSFVGARRRCSSRCARAARRSAGASSCRSRSSSRASRC